MCINTKLKKTTCYLDLIAAKRCVENYLYSRQLISNCLNKKIELGAADNRGSKIVVRKRFGPLGSNNIYNLQKIGFFRPIIGVSNYL